MAGCGNLKAMTKDIIISGGGIIHPPRTELAPRDVVESWLASYQSERTQQAYARELKNFAIYLGLTVEEAVEFLFGPDHTGVRHAVENYRGALIQRELAPATVNLTLAALRSLINFARQRLQITTLTLEVSSESARSYVDTAGPPAEDVKKLLRAAIDGATPRRDAALVLLLFGAGLRLMEALNMDLCDWDPAGNCIYIVGKGRRQKEPVHLAEAVADAMNTLYTRRRSHGAQRADPLFVNASMRKPTRLTARGAQKRLETLSERAGIKKVRPHGLRHAAVTISLDEGRKISEVAAFARHATQATTERYDDNRRKRGAEIGGVLTDPLRNLMSIFGRRE